MKKKAEQHILRHARAMVAELIATAHLAHSEEELEGVATGSDEWCLDHACTGQFLWYAGRVQVIIWSGVANEHFAGWTAQLGWRHISWSGGEDQFAMPKRVARLLDARGGTLARAGRGHESGTLGMIPLERAEVRALPANVRALLLQEALEIRREIKRRHMECSMLGQPKHRPRPRHEEDSRMEEQRADPARPRAPGEIYQPTNLFALRDQMAS